MNEPGAIRMIRDRVFAQEQGIDPNLDWDGKDDQAVHLLAYLEGEAVGVLRLRELENLPTLKLERLAVLPDYRQQGIGSELVYTAIAYAQEQGYRQITLHAQVQTVEFYRRLGFETWGDRFFEAGIEHIQMAMTLDDQGSENADP